MTNLEINDFALIIATIIFLYMYNSILQFYSLNWQFLFS